MVSICSEATIGALDVPLDEVRRFRFNLVVDGEGEDALVGRTITVGGATLEVMKRIDRCVMVTRPQPDGIERDLGILKRINADRAGSLGVGAVVRTAGHVAVGDDLLPAIS